MRPKKSEVEVTGTSDTDDWALLAEDLNPETNQDRCEKFLVDEAFLGRLKQRLVVAKGLMLEARIEGAAMFRDVCKILCHMMSLHLGGDDELRESTLKPEQQEATYASFQKRLRALEHLAQLIDLPRQFITLLDQLVGLEKTQLTEVSRNLVINSFVQK